jgi:two-component system cell cycle response regulator
MGGEEFAIILPETDLPAALIASERMRSQVAEAPVAAENGGPSVAVTISIGVASLHDEEKETAEALLNRSDAALYKAKETGRNRVVSEG